MITTNYQMHPDYGIPRHLYPFEAHTQFESETETKIVAVSLSAVPLPSFPFWGEMPPFHFEWLLRTVFPFWKGCHRSFLNACPELSVHFGGMPSFHFEWPLGTAFPFWGEMPSFHFEWLLGAVFPFWGCAFVQFWVAARSCLCIWGKCFRSFLNS